MDGDVKINLDAGDNKIKYYETDNSNCVFEIMTNTDSDSDESCDSKGEEYHEFGEIKVISVLDYGKREYLQGAKVNLYKINGLSPVLIESKVTDENGIVIFEDIQCGSYRIIEIVDKRFFEKPKYIKWNEITIDDKNLKEQIVIVNKLKKRKES